MQSGQITKEQLLKERVDRYSSTTLLQQAILLGDTEQALYLIKTDAEETPAGSILNEHGIGGNSALLLALKTGQLEIARAILNRPNVDINLADDFGMKAIHWAAFLRAHDIIQTLLDMKAETELKKSSLYSSNNIFKQFAHLSPADFYETELGPRNLLDIPNAISDANQELIELKYPPKEGAAEGAKVLMTVTMNSTFKESNAINRPDLLSKKLQDIIPNIRKALVHVPLKTMAFYFDVLGPNYGVDKGQFINAYDMSSTNEKDFKTDTQIFRHNFEAGYPQFQQKRNAIEPNKEILAQLQATHKQPAVDTPTKEEVKQEATSLSANEKYKIKISEIKRFLIDSLSKYISFVNKQSDKEGAAVIKLLDNAIMKVGNVKDLNEFEGVMNNLRRDLVRLPTPKKISIFGPNLHVSKIAADKVEALTLQLVDMKREEPQLGQVPRKTRS